MINWSIFVEYQILSVAFICLPEPMPPRMYLFFSTVVRGTQLNRSKAWRIRIKWGETQIQILDILEKNMSILSVLQYQAPMTRCYLGMAKFKATHF